MENRSSAKTSDDSKASKRQSVDKNHPSLYCILKDGLESLHWVIGKQDSTLISIERKSVLLASLCLVIMGYLIGYDGYNIFWWMKIPLLFIIIALGLSTFLAASILEIHPLEPIDNSKKARKTLDDPTFESMYNLTEIASSMYDKTQKDIGERISIFNTSLLIGKIGIVLAFLWIIVDFVSKFSTE